MRDTLNRLLHNVRVRTGMSPLMTIIFVILVPFPLLALTLLVDRRTQLGKAAISSNLSDHSPKGARNC